VHTKDVWLHRSKLPRVEQDNVNMQFRSAVTCFHVRGWSPEQHKQQGYCASWIQVATSLEAPASHRRCTGGVQWRFYRQYLEIVRPCPWHLLTAILPERRSPCPASTSAWRHRKSMEMLVRVQCNCQLLHPAHPWQNNEGKLQQDVPVKLT
jgi:hypothetical protein